MAEREAAGSFSSIMLYRRPGEFWFCAVIGDEKPWPDAPFTSEELAFEIQRRVASLIYRNLDSNKRLLVTHDDIDSAPLTSPSGHTYLTGGKAIECATLSQLSATYVPGLAFPQIHLADATTAISLGAAQSGTAFVIFADDLAVRIALRAILDQVPLTSRLNPLELAEFDEIDDPDALDW